MEKEKIKELLLNKQFIIEDVIDCIIDLNGIIGVGLITLGDNLKDYCYKHKGYIHKNNIEDEK